MLCICSVFILLKKMFLVLEMEPRALSMLCIMHWHHRAGVPVPWFLESKAFKNTGLCSKQTCGASIWRLSILQMRVLSKGPLKLSSHGSSVSRKGKNTDIHWAPSELPCPWAGNYSLPYHVLKPEGISTLVFHTGYNTGRWNNWPRSHG